MKADKKIEEMLEYLNINAKAFSEKLGYERPQIIYDIQKGKTKRISEDLAVKITSVFPMIRKSWLLADEGEMLLDASSSRSHEIKYYPDVWGSLGDRLLGNADERTAEIWHMPAYSDCQYAINAYGDSMSPLIKNGDVVLLSEWNENYIEWGLVYLVITRAGHRTIKRLYANGDDGVICRSENSEKNPDFLIQKSDILKLYIVKGRLSRDTL
jgi:plasmid maintenance system antidote protein VapI